MFFRSTLIAHKTARKPYFMGLVVHKEIISKNSQTLVNSMFAGVLLCLKIVFGVNLV